MHTCPECGEDCDCFDGAIDHAECVHDCGDDDAGYALPGEFDDDDQEHDFTEDDVAT